MEIPIKIREEIARRADAHVRSLTDDDFRYILDQWDAWSAGELIEQEKVSEYSMQVERMEAYYRAHGKLPE